MNRKVDFLSQEEVKAIIKLSTPLNFRLGKEIFDKGGIEIIEYTDNKIIADIGDSQRRKVEFLSTSNGLQWSCTCKRNQKKFCKHAVALGLEITKSGVQ
ncbi:MAG: SWIM zinc finger family protein [Candidatus Methanoperedens sp.]|nr:SWIM zinc finger family protein [Candidatus Methanoperedens sp.]